MHISIKLDSLIYPSGAIKSLYEKQTPSIKKVNIGVDKRLIQRSVLIEKHVDSLKNGRFP